MVQLYGLAIGNESASNSASATTTDLINAVTNILTPPTSSS